MTMNSMNLMDVIRQCGDQDLLRQLAETTLAKLMEFEVAERIGAGRHERCEERQTYRNGYRDRTLETRLGSLELAIPKLRNGSYFPSFLEPRRLSERALVAVIQQAWVSGVSTRKMDDLVKAMGCEGISKSQVSELCQALDERVNDFLHRPLAGDWPYLWLDATYLKVRQGGRVVSIAAIIATSVNPEGKREILGLGIGASEAKEFWVEFLRTLVARGLSGVQLVISDSHIGLKTAIGQVLTAAWQRCRVHFTRNLQVCVPKDCAGMVAALLRQIFTQPDKASASAQWRRVADQLRDKYPKAAALMDDAEDDVLACLDFPAAHRSKLHSTNPLERLNKEVKRRTDVVGIFPNEASIFRLVGAVLMETHDDWIQGKRYMTLESMVNVSTSNELTTPALTI
ncbi:IS256 family transposase [Methylomonas rosea]|uniref:Mutator family transposase n=1 Tax=Methylomonas rosea TaxID=2952227 RepID=A0ABT1TYZ5_9GAMM|nr:IS256 family transposase [Methylomonas sp. WSC-7]MCQ8119989.1 IS256 family transposase [Methylomonas sp. WSC-7]